MAGGPRDVSKRVYGVLGVFIAWRYPLALGAFPMCTIYEYKRLEVWEIMILEPLYESCKDRFNQVKIQC